MLAISPWRAELLQVAGYNYVRRVRAGKGGGGYEYGGDVGTGD